MGQSKKLRFPGKHSAATALATIGFCSVFAHAGWFGSGAVVHPSDFRGRLVLIDFWASWRSSCKTALPFYESLYIEHHAQGFVVLGVDEGDASKTAVQAAKLEGGSYPVLLDGEGRIRGRWFGSNPADSKAMRSTISELLKRNPRPVGAPRP
ncbi:MAG TPA: TlpA disulfide reductase family protein [Elusimicrobiota bacterium]|nr:TlpA disulfide reductase family protein [Elusimicrobiota bacterium]